jgi:transcriptional regulator with XRE-family HTH domain
MTGNEEVESYPSADEVLTEALHDAEVRAEWDQTKLARDVALWVVRHRNEHGLTQTALAEQLGWKQPVVARLERGDHEPSMATLRHLVQTLGDQARISIDPDGGVRLVVRRSRSLRRLRMPGSVDTSETAARTLESAARRLSKPLEGERKPSKQRSPAPRTSDEKAPTDANSANRN